MAPIYDSGTSLWHDTQFVGQAPKSKPFRSAHVEQIKLVRDVGWFEHCALYGISDECSKIFAKSEFIDEKRRDALTRAIEDRVKEITQMKSLNRAKPSLSEALEATQKKVDEQTYVKDNQPRNRDER